MLDRKTKSLQHHEQIGVTTHEIQTMRTSRTLQFPQIVEKLASKNCGPLPLQIPTPPIRGSIHGSMLHDTGVQRKLTAIIIRFGGLRTAFVAAVSPLLLGLLTRIVSF
jgi:hypothetical protein